jgi:hypothetical protein
MLRRVPAELLRRTLLRDLLPGRLLRGRGSGTRTQARRPDGLLWQLVRFRLRQLNGTFAAGCRLRR